MVVWIYYSAMILLLGAELTAIRMGVLSGSVQPKLGAVKFLTEERIQPERAA